MMILILFQQTLIQYISTCIRATRRHNETCLIVGQESVLNVNNIAILLPTAARWSQLALDS